MTIATEMSAQRRAEMTKLDATQLFSVMEDGAHRAAEHRRNGRKVLSDAAMNKAEIAAAELRQRGFSVHPHMHFAAEMLKPMIENLSNMACPIHNAYSHLRSVGNANYPEFEDMLNEQYIPEPEPAAKVEEGCAHPHLRAAGDKLWDFSHTDHDTIAAAVRLADLSHGCYPAIDAQLNEALSPVVWTIQKDRAFIAGDLVTGRTVYSYPGSPNALRAVKSERVAAIVAQESINRENLLGDWRDTQLGQEHDERNWVRLDAAECPACQQQPGKYHSCNGGWGTGFPPVWSNRRWEVERAEQEVKVTQALPRGLVTTA